MWLTTLKGTVHSKCLRNVIMHICTLWWSVHNCCGAKIKVDSRTRLTRVRRMPKQGAWQGCPTPNNRQPLHSYCGAEATKKQCHHYMGAVATEAGCMKRVPNPERHRQWFHLCCGAESTIVNHTRITWVRWLPKQGAWQGCPTPRDTDTHTTITLVKMLRTSIEHQTRITFVRRLPKQGAWQGCPTQRGTDNHSRITVVRWATRTIYGFTTP